MVAGLVSGRLGFVSVFGEKEKKIDPNSYFKWPPSEVPKRRGLLLTWG